MGWRLHGTFLSLALGFTAGWFAWSSPPTLGQAASVNPPTAPQPDAAARYHQDIQPTLDTYCYDCHGDGTHKGDLALDSFSTIESMQKNREMWHRIREHISFKLMPPPDKDQPDDATRRKLIAWIDAAVFPVDPAHPDPGHVTLHRLNREEYRNTIHDLLGVDVAVESILPPDDSGYGFDNIGDVLTLSPAHLERYLTAARQALEAAVHPEPMPVPKLKLRGQDLEGPGYKSEEGRMLAEVGEAFTNRYFAAGRYRVVLTASGTMGGGIAPKAEFRLDGELLKSWDVPNRLDAPGKFEIEIKIAENGKHRIGLNFPNDFWDEKLPDPAQRDRNLMVNRLSIEGPLDGPPPPRPESHRRIYGERSSSMDDRTYALQVLTRFARNAFRRPVRPGEVERYLGLLKVAESQHQGVDQGIRLALEAMLVSPSFLFREEAPVGKASDGRIQIDDFALASRLSYFLWSSMPDEALLARAERGELRAHLDEEVTRMIVSEKSRRFISNFGGQWLQLRNLTSVTPDDKRFPAYNQAMGNDMRQETELLLQDVLQRNLPVTTLLDADYTFLNQRLANYYGIPGVSGGDFQKVSLAATPRRGLLGQGAVLTVTSYPTRTSPVLRGKYVLENLLDTPPPPPPPNVPQLQANGNHGTSLREQMELHRKDPACATCHSLMDPIGFGLEQFDAVGGFRDRENGKPIDTSGRLADGSNFSGPTELRELLVHQHREDFHRALATKLLTYALGRGLEWYDRPAIDAIVAKAAQNDGHFQTFIRAVVESVPFQYRRASASTAGR